jgi:hypothetical protein
MCTLTHNRMRETKEEVGFDVAATKQGKGKGLLFLVR